MVKSIKISDSDRDYYCAMKFRMLKIDTERKLTYNCDPAVPHAIDFNWLENNPGQLFNTDVNINERKMMLSNTRNPSCEQNCWPAEDVGAISPRILRKGYEKTHFDVQPTPEIIDLTIGSDCNLTCSYCLKEYSSSWRQDLLKNGSYNLVDTDDDRYNLNTKDKVLLKISQSDRYNSKHSQLLYKEVELLSPTLQHLIISGGEPFLNNDLLEIVKRTSLVPDVKIFTGLGVEYKRFEKILDQLKEYKNVRLAISAEGLDKFLEFNRYGIKTNDFLKKIEVLEQYNINFVFHSTLSNLSLFGFNDFYNKFNQRIEEFDLVYQPKFMAVYVMDPESKDKIKEQLSTCDFFGKEEILTSLSVEPTQSQIQNIKNFLIEFTKRRTDLNINIFPKSFLDWMHNVV
jgi:organic radical activating enzyme